MGEARISRLAVVNQLLVASQVLVSGFFWVDQRFKFLLIKQLAIFDSCGFEQIFFPANTNSCVHLLSSKLCILGFLKQIQPNWGGTLELRSIDVGFFGCRSENLFTFYDGVHFAQGEKYFSGELSFVFLLDPLLKHC